MTFLIKEEKKMSSILAYQGQYSLMIKDMDSEI